MFQTAVPAEKAAFPAGFDFLIQFFELSETDQVGDGIVLEEQFMNGEAASLSGIGEEALAEDHAADVGQCFLGGVGAFGGNEFEEARDRLRSGVGMQGGDDDVTGFGRLHGDLGGLAVAHLADENDIGRLPERGAQGFSKIGFVLSHFSLRDQAGQGVWIDEFDRVLECDEVFAFAFGPVFQHGGDGGAFAAAGRTADQKQSIFRFHQRFERAGGDSDFRRIRNRIGQEAHDPAQTPTGRELIDTKSTARKRQRIIPVTGHYWKGPRWLINKRVVNQMTIVLETQWLPRSNVEITHPRLLGKLVNALSKQRPFSDVFHDERGRSPTVHGKWGARG